MKKQVTISEVLALLDAGKSRKEIAESLEISQADCTRLFKHPALIGKKAKKQVEFDIIDDTKVETIEAVTEEIEVKIEVEIDEQPLVAEIEAEKVEDSQIGVEIEGPTEDVEDTIEKVEIPSNWRN